MKITTCLILLSGLLMTACQQPETAPKQPPAAYVPQPMDTAGTGNKRNDGKLDMDSTVSAINKLTPGQQLAYIESDGKLKPANDFYVKKLDRLINKAAILYNEPVDSITNITYKVQSTLKQDNVIYGCDDLLQGGINAKSPKVVISYRESLILIAMVLKGSKNRQIPSH